MAEVGHLTRVTKPGDDDFVVLSDRHAADIVFRLQIFGQRGAHDLSPDVGWRLEVAAPEGDEG